MTDDNQKTNWLLQSFIGISLVIHFFVFLHVADIYKTQSLSYIELSMHQISKPNVRNIPKPRVRQKNQDILKTKVVRARQTNIPKIKIDRIQVNKMDKTYETISIPSLPDNPDNIDVSNLVVANLPVQPAVSDIEPHGNHVEFTSAKEYFEMVNLRIHSAKKYPESAKSNHLEGRVKVEFVLQTDGSLISIKIVKSSQHRNLDDAAVEAIKNASPFPSPPSFIFKEPLTLRVNILFELV